MDRCHPYFAVAFMALSNRMVINAVHIWIITAFLDVPMKVLICSNCGIYADFQQIAFGNYPSTDVDGFYRKIPTGEGKWSRNYATGMVTFTFADGKTTSGVFTEGPVTEDLGNSYSKTVDEYAFVFNLNGTDDWDNIYSDYDKFVKRPRRYWVDLEKVD